MKSNSWIVTLDFSGYDSLQEVKKVIEKYFGKETMKQSRIWRRYQ